MKILMEHINYEGVVEHHQIVVMADTTINCQDKTNIAYILWLKENHAAFHELVKASGINPDEMPYDFVAWYLFELHKDDETVYKMIWLDNLPVVDLTEGK